MPKLTLEELTEGVKLLTTPELDRLVDRAQLILSMRADDAIPKRGRPRGSGNKARPHPENCSCDECESYRKENGA